jgi:hypothetical protein
MWQVSLLLQRINCRLDQHTDIVRFTNRSHSSGLAQPIETAGQMRILTGCDARCVVTYIIDMGKRRRPPSVRILPQWGLAVNRWIRHSSPTSGYTVRENGAWGVSFPPLWESRPPIRARLGFMAGLDGSTHPRN